MSAIGAALVRGVASLGGPQVAAAIVVGGIVVGGLGGAYAGSRSSGQSVVPAGELAVYPCPDQGPALLTVRGGQKLLATGRTEDGTWLRIHYPLPGRTEAWVQSSPLKVAGVVASLPVAVCAAEVAMAPPDVAPLPPLTAIQNNTPPPPPTPEPTPTPTPEPTPSPTPNARPSLTSLTVSTKKISYDTGAYCPTAVKKVTFKVKASDASGVDSVTLFWREPGASAYAQSAMTRSAGTAASGTWQVTLDTKADGITKAGKLAFYAVATDSAGATRRIPTSGSNSMTVAVCANTGPTITSAASSSGSSLFLDPQCGPTTTNIKATVKDIDGVKSVTLFWRKPGAATYAQSAMTRTTGTAKSGTWQVTLDTKQMTETGTLSWYIKAVDTKNLARQTKTASITIRSCDTTAPVIGRLVGDNSTISLTSNAVGAACRPNTVTFRVTASDPESGITRVDLHWTNPAGAQSSRSMTLTGNVWTVTLNAITDQFSPGTYGPVYATAINGVKLTSQSGVTRFSVVKC